MRAILQRVTSASVTVDGHVVGTLPHSGADSGTGAGAGTGIGTGTRTAGLLVLAGVTHTDTPADVAWLARKIADLRIFDGELSALEIRAGVLLVSQFTLYADTRKGRRPSWSAAAPGPVAEPVVASLAAALTDLGLTVATGVFGAHMHVALVNDGPVTIFLDSADRPGGRP